MILIMKSLALNSVCMCVCMCVRACAWKDNFGCYISSVFIMFLLLAIIFLFCFLIILFQIKVTCLMKFSVLYVSLPKQ